MKLINYLIMNVDGSNIIIIVIILFEILFNCTDVFTRYFKNILTTNVM